MSEKKSTSGILSLLGTLGDLGEKKASGSLDSSVNKVVCLDKKYKPELF